MRQAFIGSVVGAIFCFGAAQGAFGQVRMPARSSTTHPASQPSDPAELEQAFAAAMTNVTLSGSFTEDGRQGGKDHYVITSATKKDGDNWEIVAQLHTKLGDINLPLLIPVKWAGDTPVMTVNEIQIPGAGTYSARVMFFGDQYAGVWQGGKHSGQLWGLVTRRDRDSHQMPATMPAKMSTK